MDRTNWQAMLEQLKREPLGYALVFLAGVVFGALLS